MEKRRKSAIGQLRRRFFADDSTAAKRSVSALKVTARTGVTIAVIVLCNCKKLNDRLFLPPFKGFGRYYCSKTYAIDGKSTMADTARALHLGHEFLGVDSPMLAYAATNAETGLFLEQVLEVVTSTAKESNLPSILAASCFLSRWR
jgi:hypothetical protein